MLHDCVRIDYVGNIFVVTAWQIRHYGKVVFFSQVLTLFIISHPDISMIKFLVMRPHREKWVYAFSRGIVQSEHKLSSLILCTVLTSIYLFIFNVLIGWTVSALILVSRDFTLQVMVSELLLLLCNDFATWRLPQMSDFLSDKAYLWVNNDRCFAFS